eukprot:Rhum_TRINITY_DN14030_c0_g1::Rhum_TRINITY_DN14030_c0_g1_i3::g.67662::m.67662
MPATFRDEGAVLLPLPLSDDENHAAEGSSVTSSSGGGGSGGSRAGPPQSDVYEALPPLVCQAYLSRRQQLTQRLSLHHRTPPPPPPQASARPAAAAPEDASSLGFADPESAAHSAELSPLACGVMSDEEVSRVTVWMGGVHGDGGARLREVMDKYGCAVVRDVLSAEETALHEELWHNDLTALAAASADAAATKRAYEKLCKEGVEHWPAQTLFADRFSHRRGLEQGGYAWAARLHPNVRRVYELLHGVESPDELCVGMDAIFFNPENVKGTKDDIYWMHSDQNPRFIDRECYQGILYTWSSEGDDASTTVVWPGSHKEVCDRMCADPAAEDCAQFVPHLKMSEWMRERLVEGGLKYARRVPVPAGAMLLFNSRLSHQGWAAGRRLAAPVCWEPKVHRLYPALNRKLWLATAGLPSTHWATLGKVHSSQPALITEVTTPAGEVPGEGPHSVKLALNPAILPFPVKESAVDEWCSVVPKLWRSEAKYSADAADWRGTVEGVLKDDVVEVL